MNQGLQLWTSLHKEVGLRPHYMKPKVMNSAEGNLIVVLDFDEYAYELGQRVRDRVGSSHNEIKNLLRHLAIIANSKTMKNLFDKGESNYDKREHSESFVACKVLVNLLEGKYVDVAHLKMECLELVKKYEACYPNSMAIGIYNMVRTIFLLIFLFLSGAMVLMDYKLILIELSLTFAAAFIATNFALLNKKKELKALLETNSQVK